LRSRIAASIRAAVRDGSAMRLLTYRDTVEVDTLARSATL